MKPSLVLFEPEIPYNVGAIIRLCACFKADLIIIRPCAFVWDINKLSRSVMDYYDKCNIRFYNTFKEFAKQHDGRIISTSSKSGTTYHLIQYNGNDAILMGKESTGIPQEIAELSDIQVNIPIHERSLNLSISSAIILSYACINFQ